MQLLQLDLHLWHLASHAMLRNGAIQTETDRSSLDVTGLRIFVDSYTFARICFLRLPRPLRRKEKVPFV